MPEVEVVVPNEIIKAEVETIRGSILATLKLHLNNKNITLSLQVAEQGTIQKVLSRKEQFELMSTQNKSVEMLKQAFDLELA